MQTAQQSVFLTCWRLFGGVHVDAVALPALLRPLGASLVEIVPVFQLGKGNAVLACFIVKTSYHGEVAGGDVQCRIARLLDAHAYFKRRVADQVDPGPQNHVPVFIGHISYPHGIHRCGDDARRRIPAMHIFQRRIFGQFVENFKQQAYPQIGADRLVGEQKMTAKNPVRTEIKMSLD